MLVTFKSPASADIVMFGDAATQLIKFMGHSDSIPGTIIEEDINSALNQLQKRINQLSETETISNFQRSPLENDDPDKEVPVTLKNRALPLLRLLQAALKEKTYLTWNH